MKEKYFLVWLGLITSAIILVFLLCRTLDFRYVALKASSNNLMQSMKDKDYTRMYNMFSKEYKEKRDQFIKEQRALGDALGDLLYYKNYKMARDSKTGDILVSYDLTFSKYKDRPVKIIWTDKLQGNRCETVGYNFTADMDLMSKIKKCIGFYSSLDINNSSPNEKFLKEAKDMAEKVTNEFMKGEYLSVYSKGNKSFMSKGSEQAFVNYLKTASDKYGQISKVEYSASHVNEEGTEVKEDFSTYSEKLKSPIGIVVWVKKEDSMYLSGFKFTEQAW